MTTYTYKTIDPPGSTYTIAFSINDSGQIVGFYQDSTDGLQHGFLDSGGIYTTIDPPGSIETIVRAINDSGQIAGYYFDSSGTHQQGFLDSGGTYTTIDPPGSHRTEPISINASGQIVGVYLDGNSINHGFLYSGGTYTILDVPGALDTTAYSINDSGTIAGYYFDSSFQQHGFLDSGGIYTTIDPPGSFSTTVTDINTSGQIVGYYQENSGGPGHSFLFSGGIYTILNFPGATNTLAYSINASAQIVGFYKDNSGQQHGFLESDGTYTTIDPPGSIGPSAFSINASGQIVGYYNGNTEHAFLATPVTVPVPVMLNAVAANKLTTLSGTAEADSRVSVFDGDKFIGAVTAGSDGTWSLQANVTGNVVHSFTETSTDLAGDTASSAGVTLYTPTAKHLLSGGNGDDVLIGRPNDTLTGGVGGDTFVFNTNFGKEIVTDYNVNQDVLAFDHRLFDSDTASQVLSQTHDSKSGAVIVVDAGDTITLTDVTVAQLQGAQQAHMDWLIFF